MKRIAYTLWMFCGVAGFTALSGGWYLLAGAFLLAAVGWQFVTLFASRGIAE